MSKVNFIITIPHGLCIDKTHRDCDRRSTIAANLLYLKLSKLNNAPLIFSSTWHRRTMDLNRAGSLFTEWRTNLDRTIAMHQICYKNMPVVLIDMHSFPSESFDGNHVVILAKNVNDEYIKALAEQLKTVEDKTQILGASDVNSLQFTRADYSFLIEINEDTAELSPEQLDKILGVFAEFLINTQFKRRSPSESGECAII